MAERAPVEIGICGGSGLYKMECLTDVEEVLIDTPFGPPSDKYIVGTIDGVRVAFLARHGRNHHLTPTEVNYRANIYGFKKLGVKYLLSASAVGSLKEEAKPLDVVLADQFIDRTKSRKDTFFGDGIVAHVAFGDPVCNKLRAVVYDAIKSLTLPEGVSVHNGGAYVCIEGPAFSTKAESQMYRSWGATVIGMTNLTEAKLAREAEIAYATICMVTDYDCWHPDHDTVTVDMVVKNLHANAALAQQIVRATVNRLGANPPKSDAHDALKFAILTPLASVPRPTLQRLEVILKKYL